jgi:hypothetical protein
MIVYTGKLPSHPNLKHLRGFWLQNTELYGDTNTSNHSPLYAKTILLSNMPKLWQTYSIAYISNLQAITYSASKYVAYNLSAFYYLGMTELHNAIWYKKYP